MLAERLKEKDYLPLTAGVKSAEDWPRRRAELMEALQYYCYGYMPKGPLSVEATVQKRDEHVYADKAVQERVFLQVETDNGPYRFPVDFFIPKDAGKPPVILNLAFRRTLLDRYVPVEEILDRGYALAVVCYEDVTSDDHMGGFDTGLCARLIKPKRGPHETGKIGVWAWAASRILDWLYTRDDVDASKTAVLGHSRLGKTALWAAATDERFWCACSNDSGFGGAACKRHGHGERVRDFIRAGSWDWYCEAFKNDLDREDDSPYDQHYLLSAIAPRLLCVGSAEQDQGADPEAEFLTALTASEAWTLLGEKGLVCPDRMPQPGDCFGEGKIQYHLRAGPHFLSRTDWNRYMDFMDRARGLGR